MKVFVTGINGQLGHDVMNDLEKRGHKGIGSDIAANYSGVADGSSVTTMPYVQLDITDKEAGLDISFVQDNQSMSTKGVLRGLHFQKKYPQTKLVRVIKGSVFDVAVDLRSGSKTYGQ